MPSDKPRAKALADPRLAALWEGTATYNRYVIGGKENIWVKGRGFVALVDLSPAEITSLEKLVAAQTTFGTRLRWKPPDKS